MPCRRRGEQPVCNHAGNIVHHPTRGWSYNNEFTQGSETPDIKHFHRHAPSNLTISFISVTQSSAAPLRADRSSFPGVHLDRPSRRSHPRLRPSGGDTHQSHGPGRANSRAGCRHETGEKEHKQVLFFHLRLIVKVMLI